MGLLVLPAQAGAADPVTHALDVLNTTAARQLAPVAQAVAAVPLPPAGTTDPVAGEVTQTADAIPQVTAAAATTVRSSASDAVERTQEPVASPDAASEERGEALRSPSSRSLPAPIASTAPLAPSTRAGSAAHAAHAAQIVAAARVIVPADARRATSALTRATANVPAAHDLNARASQIAGALIEAVGGLARSTQTALAAIPTIGVPMTLEPLVAAKATPTATAPAAAASLSRSTQLAAASPEATGATKSIAPAAPDLTRLPTALGVETILKAIRDVAHVRGTSPGPTPDARASTSVEQAAVADGAQPGEPRAKPLTASAASPSSPSPSPGGVSPSSGAAIGGSSLATYLAVVALLLLAGPRSLRHMRLAATSPRAAQFALIPERPG